MSEQKSPFDNVIQMFPGSGAKAMKQAFYNTLAILFVAIVLLAAYALYYVLEAFLKPLLWACAVGICLHPFKNMLTQNVRNWLKRMDESGSPLALGAIVLPIQCLSSASDIMANKIHKYAKVILFFTISIPLSQVIYYYGPITILLTYFRACFVFVYNILGLFSTFWVGTLLIGYVLLVIFYWNETTAPWLKGFSVPIWLVLIVYLAGISGPLRVPLFFFCTTFILIGSISYANEHNITIFSVSHIVALWEYLNPFRQVEGVGGSSSSPLSSEEAAEVNQSADHNNSTTTSDDEFSLEAEVNQQAAATTTISGDNLINKSSTADQTVSDTVSPPHPTVAAGGGGFTVIAHFFQQLLYRESSQEELRGDLLQTSFQRSRCWSNCSGVMTAASPSFNDPKTARSIRRSRSAGGLGGSASGVSSPSPAYQQTTTPTSTTGQFSPQRCSRGHHTTSQSHSHYHQHAADRGRSIVRSAFICLLWAHIVVYVWKNLWLIPLLPLLIIILALKKLTTHFFGGKQSSRGKEGETTAAATSWLNYLDEILGERKQAIAPIPIRGLVKLVLKGDRKVRHFLDVSLDHFVSIFVILLVIVGALLITIFLAFHVQQESIQLITMTSNVLNKTLQSEHFNWLPQRDSLTSFFDSMAGNAYLYGREWISKKIDQLIDTNPYNKARIEDQALQLWEKLYQRLVYKNSNGTAESGSIRKNVWQSPSIISTSALWETLKNFEVLDLNNVIALVKENLGLVYTVSESLWLLLKSNLNLGLSLFTGILSFLLGGGTVVLNFFVSSLIFLTALFYLLAYSGDVYLPVQFITSLTPQQQQQQQQSEGGGGTASRLCGRGSPAPHTKVQAMYAAVEAAVSSVFAATVKMALFYGFYTVLTHNLFGVNLVVIPAVLAAILGAVPFIGTYWAALPGVMEIALIHQEYLLALSLFLFHMLPSYFLDTAIYSEIKGAGHPYLTGLAIAGGVYCFGLAGAILGPILLCLLLVAVNVYTLVLTAAEDVIPPVVPHPTTNTSNNSQQAYPRKRSDLSTSTSSILIENATTGTTMNMNMTTNATDEQQQQTAASSEES